MSILQKIKVLYFDSAADTTEKFIELCSDTSVIEIVGTFRSFSDACGIFDKDIVSVIGCLEADVVIIKQSDNYNSVLQWIDKIKTGCHIKLLGLLSGAAAADAEFCRLFDHYTVSSDDGLITDGNVFSELLYKIRFARLNLLAELTGIRGSWAPLPSPDSNSHFTGYRIIAIGASAGGTEAITSILSSLPVDVPPIVIVQHMPESFTDFFSKNLASRIPHKLCVALGGERLERGTVYIAGYNKHLEIKRGEDGSFITECISSGKVSGHCPSVDVLFSSVAKAARAYAIGIILTGMGNDGAQGLHEMYDAGAYTIGQDKASCAVYGMPMAAYKSGAVHKQLPLCRIADKITALTHHDRRNGK